MTPAPCGPHCTRNDVGGIESGSHVSASLIGFGRYRIDVHSVGFFVGFPSSPSSSARSTTRHPDSGSRSDAVEKGFTNTHRGPFHAGHAIRTTQFVADLASEVAGRGQPITVLTKFGPSNSRRSPDDPTNTRSGSPLPAP